MNNHVAPTSFLAEDFFFLWSIYMQEKAKHIAFYLEFNEIAMKFQNILTHAHK